MKKWIKYRKFIIVQWLKNSKIKKKIFGGIAVLAIAAAAVWNVSLNSNSNSKSNRLSAIFLANVEALAQEITNPPSPDEYTRTPKYRYNPKTEKLDIIGYCCNSGGWQTSCIPENC